MTLKLNSQKYFEFSSIMPPNINQKKKQELYIIHCNDINQRKINWRIIHIILLNYFII